MSRAEDDGDVVSYCQKFPGKVQACELRHSLIQDDKVEAGWIGGEELQCLGAVSQGSHCSSRDVRVQPVPIP